MRTKREEEFIMKQVLKFLTAAALLLALAFTVTACGSDDDYEPEAQQPANGAANGAVATTELNIHLIAHSFDSILDDGSFNQGAWQGIERWLAANPGSPAPQFALPHTSDDEARIAMFLDAYNAGADVLVLPGFHFATSVYTAQAMLPNLQFVVLDTTPSPGAPASNLVSILYAEHESGFLAGYAAVREGLRNLGFMGGAAVPAVVRFGHGFVQGAEHAAAEMGLSAGDVTVNFMYLGGFAPSPEHAATASSWFAGGTEVIFAAAGGAGASVMAGAEGAGGLVIGVDVDQSGDSETVLTSAVKGLASSVYQMLNDIAAGNFRGGNVLTFGAVNDGVGLPMETSRFTTFTQAQYDAIFAQLVSGAVSVSDSLELSDITSGLTLVTVVEM
jgi:basic membrane protein A